MFQLGNDMSANWKTVRVFISSTFRDMQAERDWLVKRVFPALRQRLENQRIHIVDVDLRWGITLEQAENDQVLELCLAQIETCRPFFLGILGERYGWVPHRLPANVASLYGLTQMLEGKSVTELEIWHGVLNSPDMLHRALFALRSPEFLTQLSEDERANFCESPSHQERDELTPAEAEARASGRREQLAALKQQIRECCRPEALLDGYPCRWEDSRLEGLEEFGRWVGTELEKAILQAPELQAHLATATATSDPLETERDFHARFIESRTRTFTGRESLHAALRQHVEIGGPSLCVVRGPSGGGKSALLAKFCQTLSGSAAPADAAEILIAHFIGASPRSADLREMLRRLCAELKTALRLNAEVKEDLRELVSQFREFLGQVPPERRCVMVLDGLDQLEDREHAHRLFWLPPAEAMPPQVRLIVTCLGEEGPMLDALRLRGARELALPPLDDAECRQILREVPSLVAKTLDDRQVEKLLSIKATRNPLYLLVALEELRGLGTIEQLYERINALPHGDDALTALFRQMILRLEADFEPATVQAVLALLATARRGLAERELLELIEGNGVLAEASTSDLFPILRQLRPYLHLRGTLLAFFHTQIGRAVRDRFLPTVNQRAANHRRLAEYFAMQPYEFTPSAVNGRKVDELPWHRMRAGDEGALRELLEEPAFLEAKFSAGLIRDLLADLEDGAEALEKEGVHSHLAGPVAEALWANLDFLERHRVASPQVLFQCVWNHLRSEAGASAEAAVEPPETRAWRHAWLREKAEQAPGFLWLEGALVQGQAVSRGLVGTFRPHADSVDWVDPSTRARGEFIASALSGIGVWVRGLDVSPDGLLLATGSSDQTARIFFLSSGRELWCLRQHTGAVTCGAFTADGKHLITGSDDKSICVWEVETGTLRKQIFDHEAGLQTIEIGYPEPKIHSTSRARRLRKEMGNLIPEKTGALGIDMLSIDHDCYFSHSLSGELLAREERKIITILPGMDVKAPIIGKDGGPPVPKVTETRFLFEALRRLFPNAPPETQPVAVTSIDFAAAWAGRTALAFTCLDRSGFVAADRQVIAVVDEGRWVRWVRKTGDEMATGEMAFPATVDRLTILPGARGILTEVSPDTLGLWRLEARICTAQGRPKTAIATAPDGGIATAEGGAHSASIVWKRGATLLQQTRDYCDGLSDRAALTNSLPPAAIWLRRRPGESGLRLTGHVGSVEALAFSRDARHLVSSGTDRTVRVWDANTGAELWQCTAPCDVFGAAFAPDGLEVAFAGRDHALYRWHPGKEPEVFVRETGTWIRAVAYSPDGSMLATSGVFETAVTLRDVETGSVVCVLTGHSAVVEALAFSADGLKLVGCLVNDELLVWDLMTFEVAETLPGRGDPAALVRERQPGGAVLLADATESRVLDRASHETLGHFPQPLLWLKEIAPSATWLGVVRDRVYEIRLRRGGDAATGPGVGAP
jgi:WD40 repeat protein